MHHHTIVAPATAPGRAALSIIRLSGPHTRQVLEAVAATCPEPRRLSLRMLRDADGEVLDQAMVVFFPGPASFTGEDAGELHLHGGVAVTAAALRTLTSLPDVRMAEPGEFTRRAVLAGRLDLTKAEAVADIIAAETDAQRRQALRQLDGRLGKLVEAWRHRLIDSLAWIEAELDFADEGDVDVGASENGGSTHVERSLAELRRVRRDVEQTLLDGRAGERVREGLTVVIAGPPNAGKSTLLNRLAGRDAAIVSPIPGTTRDNVEVRCDLGGLAVTIVDTAGVRDTNEPIEQEGIRRTHRRMAEADLVLWLRPRPNAEEDEAPAGLNTIVIDTKDDLQLGPRSEASLLSISAVEGTGIDALWRLIQERLEAMVGGDAAVITRVRHRQALERVALALARLPTESDSLHQPIELIAQDVRDSIQALGMITGRVGAEDILDRVFSTFCIGK